MNVYLKLEKEELIKKLHGKKVVIWGAGECADNFLSIVNDEVKVAYYIDKNEKKWGTEFHNVKILPPTTLMEEKDVCVVIASMYFKSILEDLEKMNFNGDVFSAFHVSYSKQFAECSISEKDKDILKEMLADEKSKKLVDYIVEQRKNFDIDYSSIYEPNQYFVEDIMKKNPEAVFVDAGAYHGETIQGFIDFQQGKYSKIYSFEMDEKNYKHILNEQSDERVVVLNKGVWSENTICSYNPDETSSRIVESAGEKQVECVPLDSELGDEKFTFIKMDIEGAETDALLGAQNIIKRDKPQLAICIYHKADDLWKIPFLIHEWVPEYKLYIRHHSITYTETVLYATIDE